MYVRIAESDMEYMEVDGEDPEGDNVQVVHDQAVVAVDMVETDTALSIGFSKCQYHVHPGPNKRPGDSQWPDTTSTVVTAYTAITAETTPITDMVDVVDVHSRKRLKS
jgi:hypothetical protein